MPNFDGGHYFLTVLIPVRTDPVQDTRSTSSVTSHAHALREAAAIIPAELLLVETDAPFLTPHPFRGAPNESYCLPYTVRALAEIRNSSAAEIAAVTSANASKNYGLYH